jgi:hypothetical protein
MDQAPTMDETTTALQPGIAPSLNASTLASPPHTHTESTLAPTSEFMRYILAAWSSRYLFRGVYGTLFDTLPKEKGGGLLDGARHKAIDWLAGPRKFLERKFPHVSNDSKFAIAYNTTLGVGSLALTLSYSGMVYKDIKNIFSEAVAAEFDKDPKDVTYKDLTSSENKIVKQTINNFWSKLSQRAGVDLLFFPAAWMRSDKLGDFVLGLIGGQLFLDTWKRKTTMFEDLVTFINNKINPRNGLGQPIGVGEVFDLYQHYTDRFHPNDMFTNVLERGTGEGSLWAGSQPIFQRMTELMNQTYAYKHTTVLDEAGHAVHQADFTLPKFIYLLGNDMIDVRQPEKTLTLIEIANTHGIPSVKEALNIIQSGGNLPAVRAYFNVTLPHYVDKKMESEKNGVIAKGSTMQLDSIPAMKIDASTISNFEQASGLAERSV